MSVARLRQGASRMMLKAAAQSQTRRRSLVVVASTLLLATAAAFVASSTVKPVATVATHVLVDTENPSIVHRAGYRVSASLSASIQRGELLGRYLVSPPMVEQVARRAHVRAQDIAAAAHVTTGVPYAFSEPSSEERASELADAGKEYRIEVEARPWSPVLDIYTQAPSIEAANRLATSAVAALQQAVESIAAQQGIADTDRVALRELGEPRGGIANAGMSAAVGAVAFLLVFVAGIVVLRRGRRSRSPAPTDAWPRTGRLAPWGFAVFLGMVWLVPFSDIQLNIPAPIDLTLDRLVLPVVFAVWLLAFLLIRGAPRLRVTGIHVAVAGFVACAFLSVIVNAHELNEALELGSSVKQLPLLLSYICLFVIASTSLHGREIEAFLTFILGLAVICALGVLIEYRFGTNIFYLVTDTILPGIFEMGKANSAIRDDLGRRMVRGPAVLPLETVAMLAMALPIALVRILHREELRQRLLYGVAACLLFAAAFATFRKSALLAPISVIATIAYFRRRELLRLAPLGLVVVIVIPVLAPGAVRMTTEQFDPNRLNVSTVNDRAADYDAIRPDVWTHMLFGRGWGAYNHVSYRILDSEILHRLVEMGAIGLAAFLAMAISVVATGRAAIVDRHPKWSAPALVASASAVSFAVISTLFDVMSFPHAVYIFLATAGIGAASVGHYQQERASRSRSTLPDPPQPLSPLRVLDQASPNPAEVSAGEPAGAGTSSP